MHDESRLFRYRCDDCRLQVFCVRNLEKSIFVRRRDDDSHSLLRLADGQFRSIKTLVLLRYDIEVDVQPVSQLADGNGYAACAKVVAALNHAGRFPISEQSLELSLLRSIALLHFRAAALQGADVVRLGGTGRTAAAVPSCSAAQENDDVSRRRLFTDHIRRRGRADDRAQLHPLSYVAIVIEFLHQACGNANLVSIR